MRQGDSFIGHSVATRGLLTTLRAAPRDFLRAEGLQDGTPGERWLFKENGQQRDLLVSVCPPLSGLLPGSHN